MPLTDTHIRNAKPAERAQKLFDGGGLFLLLNPNGSRYWRLKYRHGGKEKLLAVGVYPQITLREARARRDAARQLLAQGIDPAAERKRERSADTFRTLAERWLAEHPARKQGTSDKRRFYAEHINRHLGDLAPRAITAEDVVRTVKAVYSGAGKRDTSPNRRETAARCHALCSRVFRWAVVHGLAERNPAADVALRDLLPKKKTRHHAALTDPADVAGLLRAIEDYRGSPVVRAALRFAALTFVRPGELRQAEWAEFDGDTWRIPGQRMKVGEPHIVPLSAQALAVLDELRPITGAGRFVFPSERTRERPMSENAITAALRRMGFSKNEMTAHGFRSTASTLLHELGFPPMVIERQLAHAERNKVAAAYNRADLLAERRRMMQAWADYLDTLRAGGNVVPLRHPVASA